MILKIWIQNKYIYDIFIFIKNAHGGIRTHELKDQILRLAPLTAWLHVRKGTNPFVLFIGL